jgi:hypothetical protein
MPSILTTPNVAPIPTATLFIPNNATKIAENGGCEADTQSGWIPLSDLAQKATLDDATASLKRMAQVQVGETKQPHIDSLGYLMQLQGQNYGPKNAADWIAAVSELKKTGAIVNVVAKRALVVYMNASIFERCYTDYSFDLKSI